MRYLSESEFMEYSNLARWLPEDACEKLFAHFDRLAWEAGRLLDRYTTGPDGVKKLRAAFPTEEADAEAVKRCMCRLMELLHRLEQAEAAAGYTATEQGYRPNQISAVSAGNESVTYAGGNSSAMDAAAADPIVRERLYEDTIRAYLSGAADANGVNLLYMGCYPGGVRGCAARR